jgi:hypothetical protein
MSQSLTSASISEAVRSRWSNPAGRNWRAVTDILPARVMGFSLREGKSVESGVVLYGAL